MNDDPMTFAEREIRLTRALEEVQHRIQALFPSGAESLYQRSQAMEHPHEATSARACMSVGKRSEPNSTKCATGEAKVQPRPVAPIR